LMPERIVLGPEQPPPTSLILRAVVLVILIAVAHLWLRYHLGWPVGNPGIIAAITAVITASSTAVDKLLGNAPLQTARARAAAFVRTRVSWSVLVFVLVVQILVIGSCSSVVVIPEKAGDTGEVVVSPVDAPSRSKRRTLGEERPIARVALSTTPFGRAFTVGASGYVPTTFLVYPVIGRRVRLGTDLPRIPTVLFRPSALALGMLASGGVFRVSLVGPDGSSRVIASDSGKSSSFYLGPPHPITGEMLDGWRLEQTAETDDPKSSANVIRKWRAPVPLTATTELPAQGRLLAEVTINGTVVASAEVEISRVRLLDVPLIDSPVLSGSE
jgi:hypothetical protein